MDPPSCAPQLCGDPVSLVLPRALHASFGGPAPRGASGLCTARSGVLCPPMYPGPGCAHRLRLCCAMPLFPCSLMDFPSLGGAVSRETFTPSGPNTCGPGNAPGGLLPAPAPLPTPAARGAPLPAPGSPRGPSGALGDRHPQTGMGGVPQSHGGSSLPGVLCGGTHRDTLRPTANPTEAPSEPHNPPAPPVQPVLRPHCSSPRADRPRPRCSSRGGPGPVPSPARGRGAAPSSFTPLG